MTKIREFSTRWDRPEDRTWYERDKEALIGSAKGSKRDTPKFRPFDMIGEPNQSLILWQNEDMRIGVESVLGTAPYFWRNCDFDEIWFQFSGQTTAETEYGVFELKPSELLFIPAGISHRSIGSPDCLRLFFKLLEAVTVLVGEDKHESHTEFEVVRKGGPKWSMPDGKPQKGKVLERLSTWYDTPEEVTVVEREYEHLIGVASEGRRIQKVRAFDFFTGITGKRGPGPKICESSVFHTEVYNTEGDQFAFHRGLDNDELWMQFRADSINESEFGVYHLQSGEMNHIPPGIAHRVIGSEGFLRIVFYSRKPWKLLVDPTRHHFESTFEVREHIVKEAPWKAAASGGGR